MAPASVAHTWRTWREAQGVSIGPPGEAGTKCHGRAQPRAVAPAALVVAGGVAANVPIREMLEKLAAQRGRRFVAPPLWLCTDNGVMIAWAAAERFGMGLTDGLDFVARPRWPLDPHAAPARQCAEAGTDFNVEFL